MPARGRICAALAAAALLATGCGGDEEPASTGTGTASAPEPATTSEQAATTQQAQPDQTGDERATAPQRERLKAKGYEPEQTRVTGGDEPELVAALEMPLEDGSGLTVYAYASTEAAKAKHAELKKLADAEPRGYEVARRGTRVYFAVAETGPLEAGVFERAVAAAENG